MPDQIYSDDQIAQAQQSGKWVQLRSGAIGYLRSGVFVPAGRVFFYDFNKGYDYDVPKSEVYLITETRPSNLPTPVIKQEVPDEEAGRTIVTEQHIRQTGNVSELWSGEEYRPQPQPAIFTTPQPQQRIALTTDTGQMTSINLYPKPQPDILPISYRYIGTLAPYKREKSITPLYEELKAPVYTVGFLTPEKYPELTLRGIAAGAIGFPEAIGKFGYSFFTQPIETLTSIPSSLGESLKSPFETGELISQTAITYGIGFGISKIKLPALKKTFTVSGELTKVEPIAITDTSALYRGIGKIKTIILEKNWKGIIKEKLGFKSDIKTTNILSDVKLEQLVKKDTEMEFTTITGGTIKTGKTELPFAAVGKVAQSTPELALSVDYARLYKPVKSIEFLGKTETLKFRPITEATGATKIFKVAEFTAPEFERTIFMTQSASGARMLKYGKIEPQISLGYLESTFRRPPTADLNMFSGLKLKTVKKTSYPSMQSTFQLTKALTKSNIMSKWPKTTVNIVKTEKIKPFVFPKLSTRQISTGSFKTVSITLPKTKTATEFRYAAKPIQIQKLKTETMPRTIQMPKISTRAETSTRGFTGTLSLLGTRADQEFRQITKPITTQKLKTAQRTAFMSMPKFLFPKSSLSLPRISLSKSIKPLKMKSFAPPKQPKRYRPMLASIFLGIKSLKAPKTLTGLEMRPIIVSRRRKRKKRR